MNSRDRAARLLRHYFGLASAGHDVTKPDNLAEIDEIVDEIIDATVDELTERFEMRLLDR